MATPDLAMASPDLLRSETKPDECGSSELLIMNYANAANMQKFLPLLRGDGRRPEGSDKR